MTDPIDVYARIIDPEAWDNDDKYLAMLRNPSLVLARRELARMKARAIVETVRGECAHPIVEQPSFADRADSATSFDPNLQFEESFSRDPK